MTHPRSLCFAASLLLALAATASARPLTQPERRYLRNLEGMVGLDLERGEGLTSSKTGASGVRARFRGLTVVRLSFRSAEEAEAYVAKRAASQSESKQLQARKAEVVLVGGARAKEHLSAAWSASLEAPSVATRLAPRAVKRAKGRAPIRLRSLRKLSRPKSVAPTSKTLAGSYLLVGTERVVIDEVKGGPDGISCRVSLEGFRESEVQQHVFQAVFDGQVLILKVDPSRLSEGQADEICFVWKPGAGGAATFIRTGRPSPLLPESISRFWHRDAE
tara:strand:- start:153 stop:980 length:828 start_codon:yes stop_codon:yes gene_type:complete